MSFQIHIPVLESNQYIPSKYTCDGLDVSPPIHWMYIPENTKSFAIIMDDPDAPIGLWIHWVVYNIPSEITELPEDLPKKEIVSIEGNSITQGKNSWNRIGYGGPCPPDKEHRYFFKIYALKEKTNLPPKLTAKDLEKNIQRLIIEKSELIARYDLLKRRK